MTISPRLRAALVGVTAGVLVVLVVGREAAVGQMPLNRDVVSGPEDWIPVTYEVAVVERGTDTSASAASAYTMYRSADGSTKKEQHGGQLIEVRNASTGRFYRYLAGEWYEHPMRPQPFDGRPFIRMARSSLREVDGTDPRVSAIAQSGVSCTFLETLPGPHQEGKIYCPELNLLPVWTFVPHEGGGMEIAVTSVVVGEPPTSFLPTVGAAVTQRTEPDGPGRVSSTPSGLVLRNGRIASGNPR